MISKWLPMTLRTKHKILATAHKTHGRRPAPPGLFLPISQLQALSSVPPQAFPETIPPCSLLLALGHLSSHLSGISINVPF